MGAEPHDVERFVRELNAAWFERRYDDLAAFFDRDVVLLAPGTGTSIVGAEAIVDSYRQFGSVATVHAFEIGRLELFGHGSFAMVHLHFAIDYTIGSERSRENGIEVYAVDLSGARPKVVWRHQVPLGDGAS